MRVPDMPNGGPMVMPPPLDVDVNVEPPKAGLKDVDRVTPKRGRWTDDIQSSPTSARLH